MAKSLGDIALAQIGLGNDGRAQALLSEAVVVFLETGQKDAVAEVLEAMAGITRRAGRLQAAARLYAGAAAIRAEIGAAHRPVDLPGYQAAVDDVRTAMDNAAFEAAWAAGQRWRVEDLVAELLRSPLAAVSSSALIFVSAEGGRRVCSPPPLHPLIRR